MVPRFGIPAPVSEAQNYSANEENRILLFRGVDFGAVKRIRLGRNAELGGPTEVMKPASPRLCWM